MKKFYLFLLTVVLFATNSYAQDFVVDGNGVLTAYNGPGGDVVIPDDLGITAIGTEPFRNTPSIRSIIVPGSVKTIGDAAFSGCTAATIILSEGVETIGEKVFSSFYLTYVSIPSSVSKMKNAAFFGVERLRKIDVHWSDPSIYSEEDISHTIFTNVSIYNATLTVPDGTKELYAASNIWGFFTTNPARRIIEESEYASIFSITGSGVLEYYWGLEKDVVIPGSVSSISSLAFFHIPINSVEVEWTNPINIDQNTFNFNEAALTLIVPPGTKAAYEAADIWKNFGTIVEKERFVVDGNGVLTAYNGSGGDIVIPNNLGITAIGDNVFANRTDVTSVSIPNGVTKIGSYAFCGCMKLESIIIPNGVTSIGDQAFMQCNFQSITIPSSVTNFGTTTFMFNPRIRKIEVSWNIPLTGIDLSNFFLDRFRPSTDAELKSLALIVPVGKKAAYEAADFWKEFGVIVEKGSSLPEFIIKDDTLLKYLGNESAVAIPNNITKIGRNAFYSNKNLTSATIPNGVTEISDYAFFNCENLTSLPIPSTVTEIKMRAFMNCSSLYSAIIPEGVIELSDAFTGCTSLSYVSIPNSIVYGISPDLFLGCNALQTVEVAWNPVHSGVFMMFKFVDVSNATLLVPNGTKNDYITADVQQTFGSIREKGEYLSEFIIDGNGVLTGYTGPGGAVVIPNTVKEIAGDAFAGGNITSLFIPASVEKIEVGTFSSSGFCPSSPIEEYIVDPANQYFSAEDGVLYNKNKTILISYPYMSGNTTYAIPETVDSISPYAFYMGSRHLEYITIPCEVKHLGISNLFAPFAFPSNLKVIEITGNSQLSSVEFCIKPDNIGQNLISIANQTLIVPVGMKAQYQALDNCNCAGRIVEKGEMLSDFQLDENGILVKYWGDDTNIIVPADVNGVEVEGIGSHAFKTQTTSITLPNTIKTIKEAAFSSTSINTITIPKSVIEIEKNAFLHCSKLTKINVDTDNINYTSLNGVLYNHDKTLLMVYPHGKTDTHFNIPNSVTDISESAFIWSSINTIVIPDGVTEIKNNTFQGCYQLTSVTLPNHLIKIGDYGFRFCDALTSITLPSTLTEIGKYAFYDCNRLTAIQIPPSVIKIDSFAFYQTVLDSIKIPASVQSLEIGAFIPLDPAISGKYPLKYVETEWTTIPSGVADCFSQEFFGIQNPTKELLANGKLVVPFGTKPIYEAAEPWKYFGTIEEKAGTAQLEISATALNFDAGSGTNTFAITSNLTWTVSCSETWATVHVASAYGNSTITVSATENTSTASRTATITVTGRGVIKTITVTQAAATSTNQLNVSTSTVNFDSEGGSIEVHIASNINWTASSSDASWVETNKSSGSGNEKIEIMALPNTTTVSRSATITIAGSGITKTIAITQNKGEYNDGGNENENGEDEGNDNEEEEKIIATPSKPTDNKGTVELSLDIPSDKTITGEFTVTMPDGLRLDKENTALASAFQDKHSLEISESGNNAWVLKISAKVNARSGSNTTYQKIVEIAYTIDDKAAFGNYNIEISKLKFAVEGNSTIEEDKIHVNVTYTSPVGNAYVDNAVKVSCYNNTLTINSPNKERVDIYSINGTKIFNREKPEGEVKYQINELPKGVIIIKGSSGWVEKAIKR